MLSLVAGAGFATWSLVAVVLPTIPPPPCPPNSGGFVEETLYFVVNLVRVLVWGQPC